MSQYSLYSPGIHNHYITDTFVLRALNSLWAVEVTNDSKAGFGAHSFGPPLSLKKCEHSIYKEFICFGGYNFLNL